MLVLGDRKGILVRIFALLLTFALCMGGLRADAFTQIASEDALYDSIWNYLFEDSMVNNGVVQSICATPEYLITIENTSNDPTQPDTVSAYYKNPFDQDGNPVPQYTLAMRNTDFDWEHGNGMTYNSNTHEIYVALYSNDAGDNEGCIYVMDPDTLSFKRKIQIAEGYNILGIDYDSEHDVYYTLTNNQADYSLQKRDAAFNLIEDFGPIDPSPGTNFQDICVCGDYIFLSPLTYGMGIGDFMNVYSISRRETLLSINMDMGLEAPNVEAEGVCMAHKGVFVCPITVTRDDGSRYVYFFETTLPWFYTIETCARGMTYEGEHTHYALDRGDGIVTVYNMDGSEYVGNANAAEGGADESASENDASANGRETSEDAEIGGKIIGANQQVLSGTNYTLTFEPDPGYTVCKVQMDKTDLELPEGTTSYTIENVSGNHRITVDFKRTVKPTPTPTPAVSPKGTAQNRDATDGTKAGKSDAGNSGSSAAASDASGNTASLHGTQITQGEQASGQESDIRRRAQTRSKVLLFTTVILILLLLSLALLILYSMHVRRVREKKLQQHRQERRQRRLAEETAGKKRRRRRKDPDKRNPNPARHTPRYEPLKQYEPDRVSYSSSQFAHYQPLETYSTDTGRSTSGSAYDMHKPLHSRQTANGADRIPEPLHSRQTANSADRIPEPLHSRQTANSANHIPEPLHSRQTANSANHIPETLHNRQTSGKSSDMLRRRKKSQFRED